MQYRKVPPQGVVVNGRPATGPETCVALCVALPISCCLAGALVVGLVVAPLAACLVLSPLLCCLPCAICCCPQEEGAPAYYYGPAGGMGRAGMGPAGGMRYTNGGQHFYDYPPPGVDECEEVYIVNSSVFRSDGGGVRDGPPGTSTRSRGGVVITELEEAPADAGGPADKKAD